MSSRVARNINLHPTLRTEPHVPQDRYPRRRRRVEERESPHIDLETRERLDRRDHVEGIVRNGQLREPKVELVEIKQPVALVVDPTRVDQLLAEARCPRGTSEVVEVDSGRPRERIAPFVVQEAERDTTCVEIASGARHQAGVASMAWRSTRRFSSRAVKFCFPHRYEP